MQLSVCRRLARTCACMCKCRQLYVQVEDTHTRACTDRICVVFFSFSSSSSSVYSFADWLPKKCWKFQKLKYTKSECANVCGIFFCIPRLVFFDLLCCAAAALLVRWWRFHSSKEVARTYEWPQYFSQIFRCTDITACQWRILLFARVSLSLSVCTRSSFIVRVCG